MKGIYSKGLKNKKFTFFLIQGIYFTKLNRKHLLKTINLMIPIINLNHGIHHGTSVILCTFQYNSSIVREFNYYPNSKWFQEGRVWIIERSQASINNLTRHFEGLAIIDTSNLSAKTIDQPKSRAPALPKLKPLYTSLVEGFIDHMKAIRYSENTIQTYSQCLQLFLRFHDSKSIDDLVIEDLNDFNKNYILKYNYSASFQNQLINSLKLFFQNYNGAKFELQDLERPFSAKSLPVILSLKEVERLINQLVNLKHRTMIAVIYSCGLRRGELINLRVNDIDSERMLIHIKGGKGKKDRMVPLSEKTLIMLRNYAKAYKPNDLIFTGESGGFYSGSSLQKVFKRAKVQAKINKPVTLHTLRHSYATHLLEAGVNLRYIQEILGHSSPKTTEIYTHVSSEDYKKIVSPIDKLNISL
jgi:integrase/recombinase XerD